MNNKKNIKISFFQKDGKMDNRAIGAGVYMVELLKDDEPLNSAMPLYIGQSVYMVKRCGEHLYDFIKNPKYFGLTDDNLVDEKLGLYFRVLESLPDVTEEKLRREREKDYIEKYRPLTQSPDSDKQIGNKVNIVQHEMAKFWQS